MAPLLQPSEGVTTRRSSAASRGLLSTWRCGTVTYEEFSANYYGVPPAADRGLASWLRRVE